jgi:hypothetical protein
MIHKMARTCLQHVHKIMWCRGLGVRQIPQSLSYSCLYKSKFCFVYLGAGTAQWYSAGLRAGWSGARVPVRAGNFFSPPRPDRIRSPPNLLSVSIRDSFLGVKAAEARSNHLPPSTAEVKNACSYTSTPQYALMSWCSVEKSTGTTFNL